MACRKRLLMIGGSGFLGTSFISACRDWRITNYDIQPYPSDRPQPKNFRDVSASGNLVEDLDSLLQSTDAVWIRAGITGGGASIDINQCSEYLNTNTELIIQVAEACARHGCQRIFYDSSEQVFGESGDRGSLLPETEPFPLNFYGVSKMIAEKFLFQWSREVPGRSVQVFRYPRVRGKSTADVIRFMLTCCLEDRPIPITVDPGHCISFVHVDDVTHANLKALALSPRYACYHVSSGRPISLFELANRIQVISGKAVGIEIKENAHSPAYEPYVVGMDWETSREVLGLPMPKSLDQMISETLTELR